MPTGEPLPSDERRGDEPDGNEEFWRERNSSITRVSELTEKYVNHLRRKGYGVQRKSIPAEFWREEG